MKKILALAVFAAMSISASATSLSWQIAGITSPAGVKQNLAVYLFITEQSGDFGAQVTTVDTITSLIQSKGDLTPYIAATGFSTAAGGVPAATGYNGNNFALGDTLSGFAVVFDAASPTAAQNFAMTTVKDVSFGAQGASTLRFGTMKDATWTAVPEPSTAVLALAGLALLLKRRKA